VRRSRVSPFAAGVAVLATLAAICWLAYFKSLPLQRDYTLRAVFATANEVHPRDPVRIAGVQVGRVEHVEAQPDGDAAIVVMTIRAEGLPIHRDATLKVRPRMFLEGVFFVDLQPGTPSAPVLRSGDTVPVTQTAAPVQLDQPLSALQADTRARLRETLRGAGDALDDGGGEAAGETLDASATALPDLALSADALAGAGDLRPLVADLGRVVGALADSRPRLQALLSDLDATTATLAGASGALTRTVATLPATLAETRATLAALETALPPVDRLAISLTAALPALSTTLSTGIPWLVAARALLAPSELGGLAAQLRDAAPGLAGVTAQAPAAVGRLGAASRCVERKLVPVLTSTLDDGPRSTGAPVHRELAWALVGLNASAATFDGNGRQLRFQSGGGAVTVTPGRSRNQGIGLFAHALNPSLGTTPAYPAEAPPISAAVPCASGAPPDLATRPGAGDLPVTGAKR
jgi:phospholipid/cholesterol/gamma-HCH transport system substrate-binding protein